MMRVLFVDDETRVLHGLRRSLHRQRERWEAVYANSADEAFAELDRQGFDIVISDMRMPGGDGCTVLSHVKEHHPQATRIVLSGQTEHEAALQMVTIAHQYLAKPCEADRIKRLLERVESLLALVPDPHLRCLVSGIGSLASAPGIFRTLISSLQNEASVEVVADIIRKDLALSAKLLQIVNSGFFVLPRPVGSIEDTVARLGTNLVHSLTQVLAEARSEPSEHPADGFLTDLQHHGQRTARIARRIAADERWAGHAFLGGLLHDVGSLVLATALPEEYADVIAEYGAGCEPLHIVERHRLGVDHGAVGGYLVGIWGLPDDVVEAVTHHHEPALAARTEWGPLEAIHAAHGLSHEFDEAQLATAPLDTGHLEALGVADRLDEWRSIAAEETDIPDSGTARRENR